jgi:predicted SAM-dependent methyltransferase
MVSLLRHFARLFKLRRFLHWVKCGHLIGQWKIKRWLASSTGASGCCLQIGGGKSYIDGWMNADIIYGDVYIDATRTLPIPDKSIDFIFAEHFIEHLSYEDGLKLIQECYRVLRPNGVLRIATPSFEGLLHVYQNSNPEVKSAEVVSRHEKLYRSGAEAGITNCHFFNEFFRMWGHNFIYDFETLNDVLQKVGFKNIQSRSFSQSPHDALSNRECHAEVEWMKSAFMIILEAEKTT